MDTMNTYYIKDAHPLAESVYYDAVSQMKKTKSLTFGWDRAKRDLIGMWVMVEHDRPGPPVDLVVTDSTHRVVGAGQSRPRYLSEPVFVRFSCVVCDDMLTVELPRTDAVIRVAWVHALQKQHGMIRKAPIDHGATRASLVRRTCGC
jgi:hypothetical protein